MVEDIQLLIKDERILLAEDLLNKVEAYLTSDPSSPSAMMAESRMKSEPLQSIMKQLRERVAIVRHHLQDVESVSTGSIVRVLPPPIYSQSPPPPLWSGLSPSPPLYHH